MQTLLQLVGDLESMPEVRNHYLGAEILVPKEDNMVKGHVVVLSHHDNGKITSRAHKSNFRY